MEQSQNSPVKRPRSATAIGIINIIFTGFGIVGGFLGLGTFSILRTIVEKFGREFVPEYAMLMPMIHTFFTLIIVIALVQFLVNAVGMAGGIGLLKRKHWSILFANIYAIATIVLVIANFFVVRQVITGIFESPMILSTIPPEERFAVDIVKRVVPGVTGIFGILFGSAYPVIVLALINRTKVKDFYTAEREDVSS